MRWPWTKEVRRVPVASDKIGPEESKYKIRAHIYGYNVFGPGDIQLEFKIDRDHLFVSVPREMMDRFPAGSDVWLTFGLDQ